MIFFNNEVPDKYLPPKLLKTLAHGLVPYVTLIGVKINKSSIPGQVLESVVVAIRKFSEAQKNRFL